MTREQFEKEAISCDVTKVTCIKCRKEWFHGEFGPYDGCFFDPETETIAEVNDTFDNSKCVTTAEVHICTCGTILYIQIFPMEGSKKCTSDDLDPIEFWHGVESEKW